MGVRPLAAMSAALVCAFGWVLWSQSVITEVYTLHLLTVVLIIYCGLKWDQSGSGGYLILACLLLGLGMSNHQTIGYTGVAVAGWVLVRNPRLFKRWQLVVATSLAFGVGLLPHAYLLVRANADPPVNWGNAKTVPDLWNHISRHQYKAAAAAEKPEQAQPWTERRIGELRLIGRYCGREYTPALLCAAIPGVLVMFKRQFRGFLLLWVLMVVCNTTIHIVATDFSYDTRTEMWCNQVFHLPLYACIAIALAFTLHWVLGLLERMARRPRMVLSACVAVGIPAVPLVANWSANNMRHYYLAEDHARNILDSMLPNAIIFPSGDHNTFPLIYKVLVEQYRPDVIIADKYGYVDLDLYRDMPDNPGKPRTLADRDRIEEWVIKHAKRPAYYTVNRPPLIPNAHMVQTSILYHLLPDGRTIDGEAPWKTVHYRNLEGLYAPRDFGADSILADYEFFRGLRELKYKQLAKALDHFNRCTEYATGVKEVLNNVGSALAESGDDDDAIRLYRQAADMDARYCPPRWNLARIYKRLGKYDQAETEFLELSLADPTDFRVFGELGFLTAQAGRSEAAVAFWQKSLTLNPSQPQIIEHLYKYHFPASGPSSQAR
jgi:Flp pilus assembly protein TadD